jgi:hypothetical protein
MSEVDIIRYLGAMDLDSPLETVSRGRHTYARNLEFKGPQGDKRPQSVPGNTLLFSALPAGNNCCIGRYFDERNNTIYWFNWNSNNNHGIYLMPLTTFVVTTLIQSNTGTQGDILNFNPNVYINSIDIIYGDPNTGDLLFWVDSLGRPSVLNIQQYLGQFPTTNPAYPLIKRSYIDLAKSPPRMAPKACYENDYLVTVNLTQNKLFKFRCRYVYDNYNKSVFSQPSEVPLPFQNSTVLTAQPVWSNARIRIYLPTGDVDVKYIELWVQVASDSNVSDWQLIYSFQKSVLNITSNSVFQYLFYNNTVLTAGSIDEINQIYDRVPQSANCGKIINGNTPMYGGITEGYPNANVNATIFSSDSTLIYQPGNGVLFFAVQGSYDSNGDGNLLTIYLTGTGLNDGNGNPTTIPFQDMGFSVNCVSLTGTALSFSFSTGSNTNITNILNNLVTNAELNGFTLVSQGTNNIVLQFTAGYILYSSYCSTSFAQASQGPLFCYPYQLHNTYCLLYFDDKGRPMPGATIFPSNSFNTPIDLTTSSLPQNQININTPPPPKAKYYAIGRGSNSPRQFYWVSNQTFLNTDLNTGQQYVYIGISNIIIYNQDIEASTPVVKYDFSPGDRIQFLQRYPITGSPIPMNINNDYPITSVEDNPIINGIVQQGSFIKFPYPLADITSNFTFVGDNFQNYGIRVYSNVAQVAANNQVYYEYGKFWAIGGYGTATPYHIGMLQTQNTTYTQAAIIVDNEGDYIFRPRIVPAGNVYYINVFPVTVEGTGNEPFTMVTSLQQGSVINNPPVYSLSSQTDRSLITQEPTFADTDFLFWNQLTTAVTLRFTGTLVMNSSNNGMVDVYLTMQSGGSVPPIVANELVQNFSVVEASGGNVQPYTINIDAEISIPANTKIWLSYEYFPAPKNTASYTANFAGWTLQLQIINPITINIIEPSLDDRYNVVLNSNGRPFAYDQTAATVYYGNKRRWGQAYQDETELNNTNRFYPDDYDIDPKEWGDIVRIVPGPGKNILICMTKRIGIMGVFQKFLSNNEGERQVVVTDDIITKNNVQFYEFDYGLQNQPDAIIQYGYETFFADVIEGCIVRISQDGAINISLEGKVQTWAGDALPPYYSAAQNSYNNGGRARCLGTFHIKTHSNPEVFFVFQKGTGVTGDNIRFDQKDNAFTSFEDDTYDHIICCGNKLLSWFNGNLYIKNNATTYCNFNGNQYYPSITHIFNAQKEFKKAFEILSYNSHINQFWEAFNNGDIFTSLYNPQTNLQQISQLIAQDFQNNEGLISAAFLRDVNSMENPVSSLNSGDFLRGYFLSCKLTYRGTGFAFLYNTLIKFSLSQKTP